MSTSINQNFTTRNLLRFALPSIIMMVFMSLYTIVDGIFVSRYVGSNALSSLNIVYPVITIVIAIATMLATGGNAIISRLLGEGKEKEARECLSQFVVLGFIVSIIVMVITFCFLTPICFLLGANQILLLDCQTYLKISILFAPFCMLQILFQSYLVTAGHPNFGLVLTIAAGIANAILDYLLIVVFDMGIAGAALATGIGQMLPAISGIFFFWISKKELHFTFFKIRPKEIAMACYNGSSEMISQLSNALITFLFNIILINLVGEPGVAAITILLYGQFLFNAFNMGFSIGISPIVGFQYGSGNKKQLRKIYKVSMIFVIVASAVITVISIISAAPLVRIFTKDAVTASLAVSGFKIFALNFLFSGINIASSGFFTALSNGKVSAVISFSRTLVFLVVSLLTLPHIWGVYGVWIAVPAAEFMTLFLCIFMHLKYFWRTGKNQYI